MSLTREQVIAKSAHGIICNSDVQDFRDTDAALREELGNQQWQHAACLTIAEGTTGWDIPTANDSLAMTTVRQLRQRVAELERDNAAKFLALRKMESDCLEHCQDWTNAQLKLNAMTRDLATSRATVDAMCTKAMSLVPGCQDVDEAWAKLAAVTREREFYIQQNLALLDRWNHGYTVTVEQARDALQARLREVEGALQALMGGIDLQGQGFPVELHHVMAKAHTALHGSPPSVVDAEHAWLREGWISQWLIYTGYAEDARYDHWIDEKPKSLD